jgi:drug/metabolite transporter superfamily protein YnfA
MSSAMFFSRTNFHLKISSFHPGIYTFIVAMYCKLNQEFAWHTSALLSHHFSTGLKSIMISISSAGRKYKAYIFQRVAMAKEITNMVAIRIICRKHIIKAGANDLYIYTVLGCIPYSHIHQSQQSFLSYCIFLRYSGIFVKAHIFWKKRISRVRISITWLILYN